MARIPITHTSSTPAAVPGGGGVWMRGATRAFTLIETMVAISVFMLAVIGPLTIVRLSLSTAMLSKDQVTAFYLAQDAIEYVVNIRNSNSKNGNEWLAGMSDCVGTSCVIDTTVANPLNALSTDTEGCTPLRYDPDTERYGCNAAWEESPFERTVTLESTDDPNRELTVAVEIRWRSGSFNRNIVITQSLFNIADAIQYSAVLAVTNANESGLGCTVSPATQTITSGQNAFITWTTTAQTQSVAVTPSISGSSLSNSATNFQISPAPTATTDYTLYAQGAGAPVPCEFEVVVTAPNAPVINSFSASQTTISSGQPITLSWDATGATGCTAVSSPSVAQWNGAKGINGTSASISPTQTTVFSLGCTGAGGTTNAPDVTVAVSASNPVAHWQFDDGSGTTASDSAGSYNGTLTSGAAWTTGRINGAVNFDNIDDNIAVGTAANLLTSVSGATEMAWVYRSAGAGDLDRIIHVSTDGTNNGGSSRFSMYIGPTGLLTAQARAGAGITEALQAVTSVSALASGTWNHVAATVNYATDSMLLYINGAPVSTTGSASFTAASTGSGAPQDVRIGRQGSGTGTEWFNGKIDDLRIYNRVLSSAEIAAIYSAAPAADTTAPVISGGSPSGTLAAGTTQTSMTVTTNENATCKWDVSDVAYASMANTFTTTGGTSHSYTLLGLSNGTSYTRYIRCQDSSGNANTNVPAYSVTFAVASGNTLVSHWLLDEASGTVADDNVSTNNGTVTGGTWQSTGGRINGALSFNGTSASVNAGSATPLDAMSAGAFTYAAWIYPTNSTQIGAILSKGTGSGATQQKRFVYNNGNSCEGGVADGCLEFTVDCATDASAVTSGAAYRAPVNVWTHVAAVYTPGSVPIIYVNGAAAATYSSTRTSCTTPVDDAAGSLYIGSAVGNNFFAGKIDDARVYSGALSASEIAAIYNAAPPTDTTAPTTPTAFTATAVSASQINLSWGASTDASGIEGYRIGRCAGTTCTTFTHLATSTTNSYSNTGLTSGTAYNYRVQAVDTVGNVSAVSNSDTATTLTPDTTAPTVPGSLTATAVSASQINLSWTASTDAVGVTGYRVERCTGASCTTFAYIATSTAVTYSNTGLTASTLYRYRVLAADAAGNWSAYATIAQATTQAAASSNLIGYWSFENTLNAAVGGFTGTASGNAVVSTAQKKFGSYSLLLDGVGDFVGYGDVLDFNANDNFTIAAWVRLTATPAENATIINKGNIGVTPSYILRTNSPNTVPSARLDFTIATGGGTAKPVLGSTGLALNTWIYLVMVVDRAGAGSVKLYQNGTLLGTRSLDSSTETLENNGSFRIGSYSPGSGGNYYWPGYIDEVCVFNTALTVGQIGTIQTSGCQASI